ncbi:hypothetical protein HNY73_013937 [Argiope bruennichi]|uniref:Uncharacterized protein n=1 Tax=Argiope bruennichi TaxID=94029 RepID=A0A8T0EMQ8_ARGBR|nr:hypothetical protein HNY73_013937 [Argiope bruennichi]
MRTSLLFFLVAVLFLLIIQFIEASPVLKRSERKVHSFTLLAGFGPHSRPQTGNTRSKKAAKNRKSSSKCPEGYKWDPYFKKCRKLGCALPGYVIRNGRCVRG